MSTAAAEFAALSSLYQKARIWGEAIVWRPYLLLPRGHRWISPTYRSPDRALTGSARRPVSTDLYFSSQAGALGLARPMLCQGIVRIKDLLPPIHVVLNEGNEPGPLRQRY